MVARTRLSVTLYIYIACLVYLNTLRTAHCNCVSVITRQAMYVQRSRLTRYTLYTRCSSELIITLLSNYTQRCFCCKLKNFEIKTGFCFRWRSYCPHVPFLIAAARVSSDEFYCYTNFIVAVTACTVYKLRRATDLAPGCIMSFPTVGNNS